MASWFARSPETVEPLGDGHINATFAVRGALPRGPDADFVLQRISRGVFARPQNVLDNFSRVARHLGGEFPYAVPTPLRTRDGSDHAILDGECWRLVRRIPGVCHQTLPNASAAAAAGAAFGALHSALDGFDAAALAEAIPNFHRLRHYLAELRAVEARAANAERETLTRLLRHADRFRALDSDPPATAIHGDCKVNNLLFSPPASEREPSRVNGILDFDTLMRGHWWWDFGDLVRSATVVDGCFQTGFYAELTRAFVAAGRRSTIERELDLGCEAPGYFAFMLAVRFLADHLNGDRYFRVARRGDNLRRALAQLDDLLVLERADNRRELRRGLEAALV